MDFSTLDWPWHSTRDARHYDVALVDVLRTDHSSMLSTSMLPADIARIITRAVSRPRWMLAGGVTGTCSSSDVNVFEFDIGGAEQAWIPCARLGNSLRFHATCLSANGAVCVVGGTRGFATREIYEFYPRHNSWYLTCRLPSSLSFHTVAAIGVDQIVCGGVKNSLPTSDVVAISSESMRYLASMPVPLASHACAAITGTNAPGFIVAGGGSGGPDASRGTYRYDHASNRWTRLCDLSEICGHPRAETLDDGAIYTCNHYPSVSTERLDVRTGAWQRVAPLHKCALWQALANFDGTTMVSFGGYVGTRPSACCFAYDTRADRWAEEPRWTLPASLYGHTVTKL